MKMLWLTILILLSLALPGVTGCGGSSRTLGQPGQLTLVFIYTDTWAPWATMKPIYDRLETQFAGQIAFQRVKTDEGDGPALTRAYRIQGHPTFLIIDPQGQELNRLIGPQSAEQLTAAIQQALALTAGQQGAAAPSATLPPLPALGAGEVALMFKLNLKRWVALVGLVALTGVLLGSLFAGTAPAQGPASQQSPSTGSGSGSTNGSWEYNGWQQPGMHSGWDYDWQSGMMDGWRQMAGDTALRPRKALPVWRPFMATAGMAVLMADSW